MVNRRRRNVSVLLILVAFLAFAGAPLPATVAARVAAAPSVTCADIWQIPAGECQALQSLYSATNGGGWSENDGWFESTTPCTWFGVTCQSDRITAIELPDNQLTGSLPGDLDDLSQLETLSLIHNEIGGNLPVSLGNLSQLKSLVLTDNRLTGEIPPALVGLIRLRRLELGSNQLSGSIPVQLANLAHLEVLALGVNELTGSIPPVLGSMNNLDQLLLNTNQLTGQIPPELGGMVDLQTLVLAQNQLEGTIPDQLGALSNLRSLVLSGNQLVGTIPAILSNLGDLQRLDLSRNHLDGPLPASLGQLDNLLTLWLISNKFSGSIPTSLCDLQNLVEADLGFNAFSSADACIEMAVDRWWFETQTMPPANLQAQTMSATQIDLSWTPIVYTWDGGFYEVSIRPPGGTYVVHGTTADKTASQYQVTGLQPGQDYEFSVRTFTPAHVAPPAFQENDLWSEAVQVMGQTPPDPGAAVLIHLPVIEVQ
ncbi:MAG: fibronectin type III domain-containing protein [Chloroflexota bacterium]|nr:fibronectin type III domain-containing protein [Chloroflexota bacterium]